MNDDRLFIAAAQFIHADADYVDLIHSIMDLQERGGPPISRGELRALEDAKSKKAALEEQLFFLLLRLKE